MILFFWYNQMQRFLPIKYVIIFAASVRYLKRLNSFLRSNVQLACPQMTHFFLTEIANWPEQFIFPLHSQRQVYSDAAAAATRLTAHSIHPVVAPVCVLESVGLHRDQIWRNLTTWH